MEKLAIVGTGIAGLACAHFLQNDFDLFLYDQNSHVGGHTYTVTVDEDGVPIPIDTGFMVFNLVTYPFLTRLFGELGAAAKPTLMSFGVRVEFEQLEYCGSSWNRLFAQRRNLLNPRFIKMLWEVGRFNGSALKLLNDPEKTSDTMGRYLEENGFSSDFRDFYLVPMSSAVWSTRPNLMLEFPAVTLIRFFHNHGFLGMRTQHPWFTIKGGAKTYVEKLTAPFRNKITVDCKVRSVARSPEKVTLAFEDGSTRDFDKVILACHADQALNLLSPPKAEEEMLLRCFKYQPNRAYLHTDSSVMPLEPRAWASWNYAVGKDGQASTHYWMNSLQGVSNKKNYFVSLNYADIHPLKTLKKIDFEHPLFNLDSLRAQKDLHKLNRRQNNRTFFCGSYFRYGFHEDAFVSSLELCRILLGRPLWQ